MLQFIKDDSFYQMHFLYRTASLRKICETCRGFLDMQKNCNARNLPFHQPRVSVSNSSSVLKDRFRLGKKYILNRSLVWKELTSHVFGVATTHCNKHRRANTFQTY